MKNQRFILNNQRSILKNQRSILKKPKVRFEKPKVHFGFSFSPCPLPQALRSPVFIHSLSSQLWHPPSSSQVSLGKLVAVRVACSCCGLALWPAGPPPHSGAAPDCFVDGCLGIACLCGCTRRRSGLAVNGCLLWRSSDSSLLAASYQGLHSHSRCWCLCLSSSASAPSGSRLWSLNLAPSNILGVCGVCLCAWHVVMAIRDLRDLWEDYKLPDDTPVVLRLELAIQIARRRPIDCFIHGDGLMATKARRRPDQRLRRDGCLQGRVGQGSAPWATAPTPRTAAGRVTRPIGN